MANNTKVASGRLLLSIQFGSAWSLSGKNSVRVSIVTCDQWVPNCGAKSKKFLNFEFAICFSMQISMTNEYVALKIRESPVWEKTVFHDLDNGIAEDEKKQKQNPVPKEASHVTENQCSWLWGTHILSRRVRGCGTTGNGVEAIRKDRKIRWLRINVGRLAVVYNQKIEKWMWKKRRSAILCVVCLFCPHGSGQLNEMEFMVAICQCDLFGGGGCGRLHVVSVCVCLRLFRPFKANVSVLTTWTSVRTAADRASS